MPPRSTTRQHASTSVPSTERQRSASRAFAIGSREDCRMRIEDYGLIGDLQTAALVGRDGSIDWLCFPRFDSGACFAALLGTEENGRWLLTPTNKINNIHRRYREGTLVLETNYETEDGAVTLIDCMPPRSKESDLVRLIVGRRGEVRMRMQLIIRFDYGSIIPWVRPTDRGIRAIAGPDILALQTTVPLQCGGL